MFRNVICKRTDGRWAVIGQDAKGGWTSADMLTEGYRTALAAADDAREEWVEADKESALKLRDHAESL